MLFGRRKKGFSTVAAVTDPKSAVEELQADEMAAKKKPKSPTFDIDSAAEAARKANEAGASVESAQEAMAAGEEKVNLFDFLAQQPDAEDKFADIPAEPEEQEPEIQAPAHWKLAEYIRIRSANAQVTGLILLKSEVEELEELLEAMAADEACKDIATRQGAKDLYYYSTATMSDNYAMIDVLIQDDDLVSMMAQMVRFNAKTYPAATPFFYFQRPPYNRSKAEVEQAWAAMQTMEQYQDIQELTNNENTRFLYSTQYLTPRYAKAISDVDLFTD